MYEPEKTEGEIGVECLWVGMAGAAENSEEILCGLDLSHLWVSMAGAAGERAHGP